jgi:hypothetical protein
MLAFMEAAAKEQRKAGKAKAAPNALGKSPLAACLLAYLIPGLGHLYLQRRTKGLVFMGAIGALFAIGVGMDARLAWPEGMGDPLAVLRSLAQIAVGLPYFLLRALDVGGSEILIKSVTNEYGNTFTEVGGLLNILVMLDAYDVAVGRKP